MTSALEGGGLSPWHGLAYRHLAPTFDPLSTRGAELHGGRWNPVGTPALYLALSPETARAEFDRLVSLRAQTVDELLPRSLATVRLEIGEVLRPTAEETWEGSAGPAEPTCLPSPVACAEAGAFVVDAGVRGLLVPSATGVGSVLVAFPQNFSPEDQLELIDFVDPGWS